jgi:pimeloyl-ACP methyl ester carboxylesterase
VDTITANGLKFSYLSAGATTAPLVLLVHGFPDTAYTWDAVLPALADAGYRAVAPFQRGYHPTEIPADGDYTGDALGRDAIGLLDALSPNLPAVLVGHDWGASAAYAAAALAPARLRLLVTMAVPHPASLRPTPRLAWGLRHFLSLRRKSAGARLRRNEFALVDELFRRWSPAWKDVPAAETAHTKDSLREPGSAEAACAYYRATSLRGATGALRVPITVPAVAFAGEHDGILVPRDFERARHRFRGSYEVIQVPGGHFMHREHPAAFIPELLRVMKDKAPAAAAATGTG